MGDRALIQFHDGNGEISPVVYLHWSGHKVGEYLKEHHEIMKGREGDVPYACARFIGLCHTKIDGNLSLGVWNQAEKLTAEDSHGDAGCFLVNVNDGSVETFGGYGLSP